MNPAVETILKELLTAAGVGNSGVTRTELAGQTILAVEADDPRSLIGTHGDPIYALDLLVKKIAEKQFDNAHRKQFDDAHRKQPGNAEAAPSPDAAVHGDETRSELHFLVDVNDYRAKQIKDLQMKALMMAERARSFQYDVELSPMSAYERLIIHTTLQDAPNVKTESQGEGRSRRVVIRYTQ